MALESPQRLSLNNNPVSPFHQRHKDSRITEFRTPLTQVRLRDPTGPGAGASREYRYAFGNNLGKRFTEWWPAHRKDLIRQRLSHQSCRFGEEKNLDFMPSLG